MKPEGIRSSLYPERRRKAGSLQSLEFGNRTALRPDQSYSGAQRGLSQTFAFLRK